MIEQWTVWKVNALLFLRSPLLMLRKDGYKIEDVFPSRISKKIKHFMFQFLLFLITKLKNQE